MANERIGKIIALVVNLLVFIAALVLVIVGQKNIGVSGLLTMLAGVVVLLVQLFVYNRRFK